MTKEKSKEKDNNILNVNFPKWDDLENINYADSFWNEQDISNLNKTLIQSALNLKEVNKKITEYERKRVKLEIAYKRKFRKLVLESPGKTETQKKQLAEIECEDEEWKLAYLDEIIKELNRLSGILRNDIDVLKTIGHNLRQELRL